jgi:hypothetical protein
MVEIASQSVKAPAHEHVEPTSAGIRQDLVERGPAIFRARYAGIDVLGRSPAGPRRSDEARAVGSRSSGSSLSAAERSRWTRATLSACLVIVFSSF